MSAEEGKRDIHIRHPKVAVHGVGRRIHDAAIAEIGPDPGAHARATIPTVANGHEPTLHLSIGDGVEGETDLLPSTTQGAKQPCRS